MSDTHFMKAFSRHHSYASAKIPDSYRPSISNHQTRGNGLHLAAVSIPDGWYRADFRRIIVVKHKHFAMSSLSRKHRLSTARIARSREKPRQLSCTSCKRKRKIDTPPLSMENADTCQSCIRVAMPDEISDTPVDRASIRLVLPLKISCLKLIILASWRCFSTGVLAQ